jgi:hypothetical protein
MKSDVYTFKIIMSHISKMKNGERGWTFVPRVYEDMDWST